MRTAMCGQFLEPLHPNSVMRRSVGLRAFGRGEHEDPGNRRRVGKRNKLKLFLIEEPRHHGEEGIVKSS